MIIHSLTIIGKIPQFTSIIIEPSHEILLYLYPFKFITYLIPKNPRERVTIHFHDSAHLKRTLFVHVCTVCLYIHAAIVAGISNVRYSTGKNSTISCAIFNLNFLIHKHNSIYGFFNTHNSNMVLVHL